VVAEESECITKTSNFNVDIYFETMAVPQIDKYSGLTLPGTNSSYLKIAAWKTMSFPFGALRPIFGGKLAVSFREGISSQEIPLDIQIPNLSRWP